MKLLPTVAALMVLATSAFAASDFEFDAGAKIINPLNGSTYPICLASDQTTGACTNIGDTTAGDIASAAVNALPAHTYEDGAKYGNLALKVHVKAKVMLTVGDKSPSDASDKALIERAIPLLSEKGKIDNMEVLAIHDMLNPKADEKKADSK